MATETVDALAALDRGQLVRLALADGETIEVRLNQREFTEGERLRFELGTDESGDFGRYQVRAHVEDGEWSPVELRGSRHDEPDWTSLGEVTAVEPLEEHRMQDSEDDVGHEG